MTIPRKDTRVFMMLASLLENGSQTIPEIVASIGRTTRGTKADPEMMSKSVAQKYVTKVGDKYTITEDVAAQVEDVLETMRPKNIENLVPSRSPNVFTPELRGYESKLFAGKRGY